MQVRRELMKDAFDAIARGSPYTIERYEQWYERCTCTMDMRDMSSCQFSPICSLSSSAPWDKYAVADDAMPAVKGEGCLSKKVRKRGNIKYATQNECDISKDLRM